MWKSDNPAVASVDSTGKIVGNAVGSATVGIYMPDGSLLDECAVSVGEKSENGSGDDSGNETELKIGFEEVSTDTLRYGEKIVLHVNTAGLPEGSSVKWSASDESVLKISRENADCAKHSDCVTCTVESVGNGSAEIKAVVVDKNGNPIIQDNKELSTSYKMNSNASLWQKIIAFFKRIFGLLKTYPQAFKGIY